MNDTGLGNAPKWMRDLNRESFFRKDGKPVLKNNLEAGKNPDGSFYLQINNQRAVLTPGQVFELAKGFFFALGITLEFGLPPYIEGMDK